MSESAILEFSNVSLGYGDRVVLEGLTFSVRRGAYLGIVGPNGSGKTTLLRAAIGLLAPRRGRLVRGRDLGDRALRIGYVPQRTRLDPIFPLRVADIVMMGRFPHIGLLRRPRAADHAAVAIACERVAVHDLLERPFRELSGGQQQRALIARALASEPDLLVLDEPTNGMDLPSETSIMQAIATLHRERGTTILLVTHLLHLVANDTTEIALIAASKERRAGGFRCAPRQQLMDSRILSDFYRMPLAVHRVAGQLVVLPQAQSAER